MRGSTSKLLGCILALACQLVGCGTTDPRKGSSIDEVFTPYVQSFETECGCRIVDLPITFGDMSGTDHIGECLNYTVILDSYSEILIDPRWWKGATPTSRERLIYHELGHCVLRRDHTTTRDARFPTSLMFPIINATSDVWYLQNREKYLDELFRRRRR